MQRRPGGGIPVAERRNHRSPPTAPRSRSAVTEPAPKSLLRAPADRCPQRCRTGPDTRSRKAQTGVEVLSDHLFTEPMTGVIPDSSRLSWDRVRRAVDTL